MSIDVHGPIAADSVFHQALRGQWDTVISLYHDQGHIASKTFDFERTISVTLGLPYFRTSVDHGTAFDIAGQGKASAVETTTGCGERGFEILRTEPCEAVAMLNDNRADRSIAQQTHELPFNPEPTSATDSLTCRPCSAAYCESRAS